MTWVLNGDLNKPIEDIDPVVTASGVSYPSSYPKASIPGMTQVAEGTPLTATDTTTVSWTVQDVAGVYTKVWSASYRTLARCKFNRKETTDALLKTKLGLGWTYGGNVYQVGDKYSDNMTKFMMAVERFTRIYPAWVTLTLYTVGAVVRDSGVFYKCLVEHTSGVLATDIAANKWATWYFHPHLDGDGKWTTKNNVRVLLTTAQAADMCQGALNYEMKTVLQARIHKDGLDAEATPAAVEAYNITPNWPANS